MINKSSELLFSSSGGASSSGIGLGGGDSGGGCGSEAISSDDIHESDAGNEDFADDNNFESNLRRRKGKIISCAKETIENASRQLRRRVPYAGHLMTPRRLWLNKIPTQCDVVIEFPEDAPDEALRWLLARIRLQPPAGLGLIAQVKSHESTKRTAFYISAPTNILYKAAEEARLPKRLRSDLGGALREFTTRESHCFLQMKNEDGCTTLFTSQERQWLVLQVLQGLRAGKSDIGALQGKASVEEGQSIVAAWQESGLILQIFPLHETSALTRLQMSWVKKVFAPQPLDDIAEYFGVKVALYFAWLGHYTCALGVPAVFGTILWLALWGRGQTAQDMGHVLFSLFNVAWASLYLEAWRRYSVELAFRWGTLSTPPELLEPPRPLYKGPLVESSVTGRLEPKEAPAWKRRAFRYFVSFPIIGLCLVLVFVVMFLMLQLQDWWDEKLPEGGVISCLSVIPKVLLAGAITLMDEAYYKLAVWLNDKENYRLQSKYENHLIAKVALFQFVNSFLSLFYIAFYLRDQEKLKEQLAGLLISRQIIGNLRESALPYVVEQWRLAKLSFKMWGALSPTQETQAALGTAANNSTESVDQPSSGPNPKRSIGQAEIESSLYKYDGTFSDHLEMLVQMGYVVLFSAAFPLAGLCALANNLLEIRSDAFKLAHVHQRPFGQRVANIGTWQNALSILSLAAVIVNCALIGLSGQVSRLWPGLTTTQTIILIVALEHVMLGLRSALTWLLPELPSWLAAEIARAEHCRREMQCKGPSPRATPPSPPSTTSMSQQEQMTPDIATTNDQSIESQLAEDIIYEPGSPALGSPLLQQHFDDLSLQRSSIEAEVNIKEDKDVSPDSPPSQISTVSVRPVHETTQSLAPSSNVGVSMQNLPLEIPPYSGASSSAMALSQSIKGMHIPEIPPFRKKSYDEPPTVSSPSSSDIVKKIRKNSSPPKIFEIPPYKPRKSTEWTPQPSHGEYNANLLPTHGPEWMKRLKGADSSTIHRSIDCIASKELASNSEPDILKPAPSWSNVATTSTAITTKAEPSSSGSTSSSAQKSPTTDDEAKAAELAAKKSRLKQSLVKRARSVAIFSLKLKERRQKEAEKVAAMAVEHAKAISRVPPPGGELSVIPIEKLIQVEDVINAKPSHGSGTL